MKILLINQPPNNRGDESAHKALIRSLLQRVSNVQIRVLYVDKPDNWDIEQYNIHDDRVQYVFLRSFFRASKITLVALRKKWRELLWNIHPATRQIKAQYDWADLVVCAPGGICMGGFQDWRHLYMLKWAKHCGKPLAYFGRSIGPFPDTLEMEKKFKSLSYELLHYFSFLSLRDNKSCQLAKEIGVPYISTVDSAFLESPSVDVPYEIKMVIDNRPYMVFVPNYLLWHYAYSGKFTIDELIDFYCDVIRIVWKNRDDMSIVMLPQTFSQGGMHDDVNLFRMIADKLNDRRVIVTADCYSSDIQQSIIRNAEFLIGARYHSIVFAINNNIPFISLSYEHKMTGLLETLGLSANQIDFSQVMFSKENRQTCLQRLEEMIPHLHKNDKAQKLAKEIAGSGFNEFLKFTTEL